MHQKSQPLKKSFAWDLSKIPPFVVWNRLKSLRQNLGLTLLQVAAASGVSEATLLAIEAGHDSQTTDQTKEKLARYFDLKIGDLFPVQMVGAITQNEYLRKKIREDEKVAASKSEV